MQYDVAIIGCGVVGAAVAYELSKYTASVIVLEAENDVADETSKANSGIFHAGYDPQPGTLMAQLNVAGVAQAKELCRKLDVPVRWTGSLVIALSNGELAAIKMLFDRGTKNGVPGQELLNAAQARHLDARLSPQVKGALYCPSAGVVYSWEYALAFIETAVRNGTELCRNFRVTGITRPEKGGYCIQSESGACITATYVVNAAGVYADIIHNMVSPPAFHIQPTRGEYYLLDKTAGDLVRHIIFQCPTAAGKGVLVAPTAGGNIIVGPNAAPCSRTDVRVTHSGLDYIAARAQKSIPSIDLRSSIRNFAGVRANHDREDFIIGEADGAPGFIDLAGIKSPGLSAAPAIATTCLTLLEQAGLALEEKKSYVDSRKRIAFERLSVSEKQRLIKKNPLYGRVICRCETITEGEIIDALRTPVPPVSVDGINRRCGTGMGRCQGGFCSPRVMELLMNEAHVSWHDVLQDKAGSYLLTGRTKQQEECCERCR
ncbi:MAG: NAD(P)/FAD-dependent oxidoreductase [Treponema sp.]|nr:NAD(P)/FAD-dependent oxidoreductase [Treponema sp.]